MWRYARATTPGDRIRPPYVATTPTRPRYGWKNAAIFAYGSSPSSSSCAGAIRNAFERWGPKVAVFDTSLSFGFSANDIRIMALNMYHEARGEGRLGMLAVGWVVLNRMASVCVRITSFHASLARPTVK